jgi:hypothetical protein
MIAAAVALIPVGGASVALAAPASAAVPSITCKALTGTANTTTGKVVTHLTKCSGNTGGAGTANGNLSSATATDKWKNGKSTTFTVHVAGGTKPCPTGDMPEAVSGKVTADTTGSAGVGGTVSENLCFHPTSSTTGTLSLSAGTTVKI